jgi:hypothetical protein
LDERNYFVIGGPEPDGFAINRLTGINSIEQLNRVRGRTGFPWLLQTRKRVG